MRMAIFICSTLAFLLVEAICIRVLKRKEFWYEFMSTLVAGILDIMPCIAGVAVGILVALVFHFVF